MKKLLLLFAAGAVAVSSNAQQLVSKSAAFKGSVQTVAAPVLDETFNFTTTPVPGKMKTTAGGSRWYNFIDLMIAYGSDPATNWGRSFMTNQDALAYFGSTGYDSTFLTSAGVVLDPSTQKYNDPGLIGIMGDQIAIRSTDAYTLDSIRVFAQYQRNMAKPNVVDTVRIAIVTGMAGANTNLPSYYFTGFQSKFGYDTVRFITMNHDTVRNIAGRTSASTPAIIVKDVYLTAASVDDTVSDPNSNFSGLNTWIVDAGNISVPANGFVAASITFFSGDNSVGVWDTIQTANGTKTNHLSAYFFTEKDNQFQTYTPGDWNVGLTKYSERLDPPSSSWRGTYVPSYAYTTPVWHENFPMEFKLSCATCPKLSELGVGVNDVNQNISDVKAYPNPANTEITIAFNLKDASAANVKITNAVGQVMQSEKLSSRTNGKVTFSTANFASGVYFYTVESNGQKVTNRFVVAH